MSGGNTVYSPLCQSNSDSDDSSVDELHISQENKIVNRISKISNLKTENACNGQRQNINNYKLLDADGDLEVTLVKFHSNTDEVSILKPNTSLEIFSISRKICFWFSLLLCVFTTVAFIWILPCNVGSCLSSKGRSNNSWNKILSGCELYGPINVVPTSSGKNKSLVFLTYTPSDVLKGRNSSGENDIVSFKGKDGDINWRSRLKKRPTTVDCKLIDVNLDGYSDCLIFSHNFLKVLNSVSGKELWDVHISNRKEQQVDLLDFPLIIPDLDGDGTSELLTSCSFAGTAKISRLDVNFQNYLVIFSGKTGVIINSPLLIKSCSAIHNLKFTNSSIISYTCLNSVNKDFLQTINITKVYNTVKNISKELVVSERGKLPQHENGSNTVYTDGYRLVLENQGLCPKNCSVLVNVQDERGGFNNKTIYTYNDRNAYGMIPIAVKSNKINGFVLKYWKWHTIKEKLDVQTNVAAKTFEKNRVPENLEKKGGVLSDSENLDKEMFLETDSKSPRFKRTIGQGGEENDTNFRVITETVVSLSLIGSEVLMKNVVKDDIIQICKKEQSCVPDIISQKYSISIVDVDEDGGKELISFTSKYVGVKKTSKANNETWQLQSVIRVMTL